MRKILAPLIVTLMLTFGAYAQSSASLATPNVKVTVPLAFVIQAEKNQDELNLRRAEVESLKAQIKAHEDKDINQDKERDTLQAKITNLEKIITDTETQLKLAQSNVGLTEQQRQLFAERLNDYRLEVADLRHQLDKANSAKKWWAVGGAAIGYGLAKKF